MMTWKRASTAWALAPVLFLTTGCSENNESRVSTEGTTTSPSAVKSPEEALKRGTEVNSEASSRAAGQGYPGAKNRK